MAEEVEDAAEYAEDAFGQTAESIEYDLAAVDHGLGI